MTIVVVVVDVHDADSWAEEEEEEVGGGAAAEVDDSAASAADDDIVVLRHCGQHQAHDGMNSRQHHCL